MFDWNRWLTRPCKSNAKRFHKVQRHDPISVERLEDRILLFAVSGNAWPNKDLITISFMPDGTDLGGKVSNLQSTFNTKFGAAATWQNQILKAAQYWAQQTNINFTVVADNGAAAGSGSKQQGDPNFGDIRIGGFNFGNTNLAQAFLPPPINNYSIAGDIQINTATIFNVGSQYDLFTVMVHEFGHSLGLNHGTATTACMYATYNGVDSALNADDISGIKAIYSAGAVRAADSQEANGSTTAAKVVTIDATSKTAVVNNLDLTTSTDLDFFKFTIPTGSALTLKATVVTQGLSLMNPKIDILDSAAKVVATATATATDYDGTTLTATFTGTTTTMAAGKVFYAKVYSANSLAAFKTGKYALVLNMGTGADPAVTKPNTTLANGTTLSSGGGVALKLGVETLANAASTAIQQTGDRAVATSPNGESVITWASKNQDGNGWGVYARRFDSNGVAVGNEFQVNTTTAGDQLDPSVAVDLVGNFTIVWTGSDANGSGIFAQQYDKAGNKLGSEFQVNITTSGDQTAPSVGMDGVGNVLVSWSSALQDGSGLGIFAQKYSSGINTALGLLGLQTMTQPSSASGGEIRVNTATTGDQTDSAIAMNRSSGDYVITWTSSGQDGSGAGIYAQRYSGSSGASAGSEFKVNTTTAGDQTDSSVAMNRFSSEFIVTWTSAGQDGSGKGVYAQRFNAGGVAQGAQILVNTSTAGDQYDSTVAIDGAGEIFAMWTNAGVTANGLQVYGQQFDKDGIKKEAEFVVNTATTGDQSCASVSIDVAGRVIVAWSGNGNSDANGVSFQRYRTDLHPLETLEHDHGHQEDAGQMDDDEYFDLDPILDAMYGRGEQSQNQQYGVYPGSGAGTDRRFEQVEALRQNNLAELNSNTESTDWVSISRRDAGLAELAELPIAIDALFGSDAWLSGGHYRGVNGRA